VLWPPRAEELNVLVAGDAILDRYLHGDDPRLCREGPVPVVRVAGRADAPGGAANTAVNVAALGGRAALATVVGDDEEGRRLGELAAAAGVDVTPVVRSPRRATQTKARVLAGQHLLARFDDGSDGPLAPADEDALAAALAAVEPIPDAIVLSDYRGGVLTPAVVDALGALRDRGVRVVLADGKDLRRLRAARPAAVTPNFGEALALLGLDPPEQRLNRSSLVERHAGELLDRTGAQLACVTLDDDGAVLLRPGEPAFRAHHPARRAVTATGAGDTFAAAFTLALAGGVTATDACDVACTAAAIAVSKPGTSTCTLSELLTSLRTPAAA
jgi:D-beta-D-heptose 7-phosphate kinase / D-beta-D-heptose 1-phosphate adenosyltransferase